jgi:hypothetical protein
MAHLVDCGHGVPEELPLQQLSLVDFTSHAQAFGPKPDALPKFRNCLKPKNFASPVRIRTSDISVNSEGSANTASMHKQLIGGKLMPIYARSTASTSDSFSHSSLRFFSIRQREGGETQDS